MNNKLSMSNRQGGAIGILIVMGVVVPVFVGLVLLVVTAWLAAAKSVGFVGMRDIHGTMWGWLSNRHHHTHKGHHYVSWTPNGVPLAWIMTWVTLWFAYELAEGFGLLVRGFANLARPKKVEIVEQRSHSYGSRD